MFRAKRMNMAATGTELVEFESCNVHQKRYLHGIFAHQKDPDHEVPDLQCARFGRYATFRAT